jgi:hypothetical protein
LCLIGLRSGVVHDHHLFFSTKSQSWQTRDCLVTPSHAFGAGNIASISKIEGHNWRHGDIEDMLEKVAFLKGHKWTSMMIKRVYFGNWLRDYSQAVVCNQRKYPTS